MHIMLKVIANPYVFGNFSEEDSTNNNYLKGIDILGSDMK